ncbi:hypothetical protein SNE40_004936 [Patella caerulea]|uniref:Uncharacterized protein n=1 Tax=Patella caerulea TaxID=87958 RepID=A0AAN8K3Y9_PATCE
MFTAGCKTKGSGCSFAVGISSSVTPQILINTLHDHGLCSSYAEVLNFESCAAAQTPKTADIDTDSDSPVQVMLGDIHFRQYGCDYADRSPWTLDGKTSLHAMGITPSIRSKVMIRRDGPKAARSAVDILHYDILSKNNPMLYCKLALINMENLVAKLDLLLKIGRSLRPNAPGWSGVMQAVSDGTHAGKATVRFLLW